MKLALLELSPDSSNNVALAAVKEKGLLSTRVPFKLTPYISVVAHYL